MAAASSSRSPYSRALRIAVATIVGLGLLVVVALAAFPWGMLRGVVADRLTDRFGRPVTITAIERVDRFGFTPTIAIRGLRVPQAGWVGPGDFVRIGRAEATFSVWPLLAGSFRPRNVRIDGLRLALVRGADGRNNWARPGQPERRGRSPDLKGLTIADAVVEYRDAKQDRSAILRVTSDARGLRAGGTGTVRGAAITIAIAGAPVQRAKDGPWPFTARIEGSSLALSAQGQMDHPLDTDAMTMDVTARADDLKQIDAVIEAGLFRSQPVALTAHVRHDSPRWTITDLKGTIGTSDLAGRLTVDKVDGRSKIDGDVVSRRFDFDDIASDEGLAAGRALEARIGPRLVPNTRIDITKIDKTDGTVAFRIGRIIGGGKPTALSAAKGRITIDHQLLTASPLVAAMKDGIVAGRLVVDQRGGRREPTLTIDLRLRNSSIGGIAGGAIDFSGRVDARARLVGSGTTIREAVGRSAGQVGFVARDGTLPERYAALLGFDAGRILLAKRDRRAGLRCVVVRLAVRRGQGRVAPLILDTTQSQMAGQGVVSFPGETLAIRLTGAPKQRAILRLPGSATITGTIREPRVVIPPDIKSAGNILKAIGRAVRGRQGPAATDADCGALAARALS